ncbi:DUF1206 domain-containing protein [Aurantiacibacter luteus]|uniref:DUF1206 domain-containing protein n=1 Tax=Aurantiacibacter luteus TaxID=1581420 RepID=A0A0G9N3H2_9SPHN|nr:DUF1206 domain-containing protein [Aurantiacibacter luteus]KLE36088.1 hypothetical protein AAW00_03930 [Aurantiacibacter luteus]
MVDKSQKFTWLVRLGYAARGLTYLLLGYMALGTRASPDEGNQAVFEMIQDVPLGQPLLYLMAIGLAAYCVFKFASAIGDVQHRGSDTKGILQRVGDAASGIAYAILAWAALQFAGGDKQSAESGQTAQATGTVLDWSLGGVLIGLVGLGFLIGGFMQAKKAYTASFMHRMAGDAPSQVELVGRVGHAARAVVFAIVGWSLVQAAWLESTSQVKGIGEALLSLRESGFMYTLVCIGLMLFGVFSLVAARYRIIPDFGAEGLKPNFR